MSARRVIFARRLDRAFDGFRSGIGEKYVVGETDLDEAPGQTFRLWDLEQIGGMPDFRALLMERLEKMRMSMAKRRHGDAAAEIEKPLALRRSQPGAITPLEGEIDAGISGKQRRGQDRTPGYWPTQAFPVREAPGETLVQFASCSQYHGSRMPLSAGHSSKLGLEGLLHQQANLDGPFGGLRPLRKFSPLQSEEWSESETHGHLISLRPGRRHPRWGANGAGGHSLKRPIWAAARVRRAWRRPVLPLRGAYALLRRAFAILPAIFSVALRGLLDRWGAHRRPCRNLPPGSRR